MVVFLYNIIPFGIKMQIFLFYFLDLLPKGSKIE